MIKEWVDRQYEAGRITAIGDDELEELIADLVPEILALKQ